MDRAATAGRAVAADHDGGARPARYGVLAAEAGPGRDRRRRRCRRRGRAGGPGVRRVRGRAHGAWWRSISTTSSGTRCLPSAPMTLLLARWRGRCTTPARRRGPGRRPVAAAARAPPGRTGEPDLPRRGRRPVDLRLAAGGRASRTGHSGHPCPGCGASISRSTIAVRRRSSIGPCASSGTTRSGSRRSSGPEPDAPGLAGAGPGSDRRARADERLLRSWPDDDGTRAVLARTNRELRPAVAGGTDPRRAVPGAIGRAARRRPAPRRPPRPDRRPRRPARRRCWCASAGSRAVAAPRHEAERELATALLAWAPPFADLVAFVRRDRGDARPAGRAPSGRRATVAGDRPLDQGRRVRSCRRGRARGGPLPERPGDRRRRGPGPRARGGTAVGLRGVDARTTHADAELRPGGPLPVPARGVHARASSGSGVRSP